MPERFRVGRHQSGNLYRCTDGGDDERFESTDGLREQIAEAINLMLHHKHDPAMAGNWVSSSDDFVEYADAALSVVGPQFQLARDSAVFWEDKYREACEHFDRREAELRRMVDDREGEMADIGRILASGPRGRDFAMSLSNEVRQAFDAIAAEANDAAERVAELTRERDGLLRALEEEVAAREGAEEWADRIAAAFVPTEVLGEHSNFNAPWANAIAWAEAGRPAAQEAPAPPAGEAGEPPAPRVWRTADQPMPDHGTRVRTADGTQILARMPDTVLWCDETDSRSYGPWRIWLQLAGPLTEVISPDEHQDRVERTTPRTDLPSPGSRYAH